ncbi:MAG TPA: DUF4261 domain-containing protein [Thermoanaerobaculia bacterium]|nr:DUF4261 domain-containing protein [Thermoanaerobaculia bacterium]
MPTEATLLNPTGLLDHYAVDLLFADDPEPDAALERLAELARRAEEGGRFSVASSDLASGLTVRAAATLERGAPPEWTLAAPAPLDRSTLAEALQQSWWWRDAEPAVARCTRRRTLSDHLFVTLDHRRRLDLFQQVLALAVEHLSCHALVWRPSQQLVDPVAFLDSMRDDGTESPLPGALNVRLFRVEPAGDEAGGSCVMDTLGLGGLGLVDLQCCFRGLDPEEVGRVLYATGLYLWQHGAVIRAGSSVQGPRPGDRWSCRAGVALAGPEREVLDLDPGFPFAAGEAAAR